MGLSEQNFVTPAIRSTSANLSPDIFQTIICGLEATQEINPSLLKSLYCLLVHLSFDGADLIDPDIGIRVACKDLCRLSNTLLKELSQRFTLFLCTLQDVSKSAVLDQSNFSVGLSHDTETLNLLLRCCMTILDLLVFSHTILMEKGQLILLIVKVLISLIMVAASDRKDLDFKKLVSFEHVYSEIESIPIFAEGFASFCSLELSSASLPFLSAMAEVLLDELLLHGNLRAFLKMIDSAFYSKSLCFHRSCHRDMDIVMELISAHFCSSVPDGQPLEIFFLDRKNLLAPQISLTAVMLLLVDPAMPSMPKFMQAHLVSLFSDAIIAGMGFQACKPNHGLLNYYLSALKVSVILYTNRMSPVGTGGHLLDDESFAKSKPFVKDSEESFKSFILPETMKNIDGLIMKMNNTWKLRPCNLFSEAKSNLLTASLTFLQENQHLLAVSCGDQIVSILSCVMLNVSSDNHADVDIDGKNTSPEDLCLLVSILKLMGSSLMQIVRCLQSRGDSNGLDSLENYTSTEGYSAVLNILNCFKELEPSSPFLKSICNMMRTQEVKRKESKMMLIHFLGLLSTCIATGVDFLVKGCLFTLMALLNLYVYEEGSLDVLRSLIDIRMGVSSPVPPLEIRNVDLAPRTCIATAAKFQEIRQSFLSSISDEGSLTGASTASLVSGSSEKHNAERFLEFMIGSSNSTDFVDLADFIEVNPEKDYFEWYEKRQRYREKKAKKETTLRWKRKSDEFKPKNKRKGADNASSSVLN